MSGRRPRETALEVWIDGYLKKLSKTNNTRSEAKFIEKAIMMINLVFGEPCCSDPENMITLITPNDNTLTHTVRQLLQRGKYIRREIRPSLFRILDLLNDALYGQCCTKTLTLTFDGTAHYYTVSFTDLVTNTIIYSTILDGSSVQSIELPSKWFGSAALIKSCINVINVISPPGGSYTLIDGNNKMLIDTSTNLGTTCSSIFEPLSTSYNATGTLA